MSVQVLIADVLRIQPVAQDGEHGRELRKNQRLVALFDNFRKLRQQHVQFRAWLMVARPVDQARMNGRLAEAKECFQDMDLGFFQTIVLDAVQDGLPVMIPQFVVHRPLCRFQLAEEHLFHFLRQVACHLCLGAPEDERAQRLRQRMPLRIFELAPDAFPELENARRPEHSRIQKFEQAPEFAEVVFDRGSAQCQPVAAAQQARRFRRFRGCVLDGLRLVEDHVIEHLVFEKRRRRGGGCRTL